MFPDLPNHPAGKVAADARFRMPVAGHSVGPIDGFSQRGGVTWSFPLVALAGRCASPKLIRNGGRGAAYLSGDGAWAETLLLEDFDGSSVFHAKMLSLQMCIRDRSLSVAGFRAGRRTRQTPGL